MPIYEYQCQACQYAHEALQKMSDPALTDCPECGAAALVKKISAAGFRLKGGGWYETDFKSGDKKKNLAGDGSGGGSSAASDA
ncbi:FmdB family zinc ribbon protein [Zhongshania aquimaris]|uniref:Zinc ribbon domain-containing protein n=1 Tax=Zhongshania aquimaris TaxID=2857107 RepID=A0ABS6VWG7_9GAMM|nr:zinc ribbon domain-containing protein [Zhongshania aquimaris]MBW2942359.1 zinc ribbon domain-containing protein [Zhongshania aquimaris]